MMNYYCEHNICPVKSKLPVNTDTIIVNKNVHFEQITALCNVTMEEVKALNPQYRTGLIPGEGRGCILRLPAHGINSFIEYGDSIYNFKSDELFTNRKVAKVNQTPTTKSGGASRNRAKYVTIRKGDTLSLIAKRNGTTVSKIKRLNGMRSNSIRAGRKLRVR